MSQQLVVHQPSRALSLAPSSFAEAINFADVMSKANLLPAHLRGSPSDCLAVVMQACRWEMDPYAVAQKTSVIGGKLMYEGQLVAAVVNTRGDLEEELDYQFSGEGANRTLKVVGHKAGWKAPRAIELTFKQASEINKNGQMQKNPDQQMCYIGARIWGRRYMPQLMLGVYAPEEMPAEEEGDAEKPEAPVRNTPPPKSKGVSGARDMKNVTPPPEEKAPPAESPPKTSEEPAQKNEPPADFANKDESGFETPELPRFMMGAFFSFEVAGKTYYDVKITSEDGQTFTAYWQSDPKWLPAVGSYARLRLETKKSSKSGQADKLFITEIHPE